MFFRTQLLISALLAISTVLGAPSTKRDGNPCAGFGSRSYTNLSKFRVGAFKPNSDTEAWELVQRWTGNAAAGYSTTFTVGNWGEDPSVNEVLDMSNSGITGSTPYSVVSVEVKDNATPYFIVTGRSQPQPAPVWCVVSNEDVTADRLGYDFLAANGRYDAWSLCYEENTGAYRVGFNVDANQFNSGFDSKSCFPVYLRVVPESKTNNIA